MGLPLEKLPDWPAAMPREIALAYTNVSERQLREWERRGVVRFCPRGPNGQAIASKLALDAALASLFGSAGEDDPIDFD